MTTIHKLNGLTLNRHDLSTGTEYRITDGVNSCSMNEMPKLDEIEEIWSDYLAVKFDSEFEPEAEFVETEND